MKIILLISIVTTLHCFGQKHQVTYFTEGRPDTVYIIDPFDINKTMITNKFKGVEECFIRSNQSIDSEIQQLENDTTLLTKKRRIISSKSKRKLPFNDAEKGKHRVKICIDAFGNIVSIKIVKSPSKSKEFKKELLLRMFDYRFAVNKRAPCIECGEMEVFIDRSY